MRLDSSAQAYVEALLYKQYIFLTLNGWVDIEHFPLREVDCHYLKGKV